MPHDIESFKKKLLVTDKVVGEYHDSMLTHVKGLISISRKEMSKNYSTWDYHDSVFRSRRTPDKEDMAAHAKGAPAKLIVPLAFAQIMTFVSFCVITATQNRRFYELELAGNRPEDVLKEPLELILARDCKRNGWNSFLVQFFLDAARFWIGCAEVCYKEEWRFVRVPQTVETPGAFGIPSTETTNSFQKLPHFVGNKVYPISPYRFYPDTRLPLTRFQEGEFCGSEDMFSLASLKSDGDTLFNLEWIPKMTKGDYDERRKSSRVDGIEDFMPQRSQNGGSDSDMEADGQVNSGAVVITKCVFDLVPKNFKVQGENVLGTEPFPVRYICWYANDKRIIRFEEAYYLHGQFPYVCAQYLPDQHKTINEGLSSVCDQVANLITWKLNTHMTSWKNSVDSKWIVDPAGVNMKSLESRSPYIFLNKNASQTGVDRYIKQFITQDVTQGTMQDISALKDMLEGISGISGMMQGQSSAGRRSATQDRVVSQGAAARAKTTLSSLWDDALHPLGRQFITNNRQEMDMETFVSIVGEGPFGTMQEVSVEDLFTMFKADPVTLARAEDFFVFDSTLPSEKAFLAQTLQEVWMQLASNPVIMQVLGYGPEQMRHLFNEIYELRGVTPPSLPVAAQQQLPQGVIPGQGAVGATNPQQQSAVPV